MKEGWKYKKLGDLCDIYQPATIAASKLSVDGKYPVYGANGIIGRHNEYNHEEAEVLLGCRGTCGVVNMSQPFSWINGNAMVIRPTKDTFSKVFLMYLLRSLDYSHIITGTAQPQITQTTLRPTEVPVPSLSEQQKIVEYLDASFAKIDTMKANAEKSLNEAKALFQSSLKELLEPKEGWEEKTLKQIGQTQTGTTPSKSDPSNYGDYIPFIRPSEINYDGLGTIEYNSAMMLSEKGANIGRVFDPYSIFMVCIGATIGKVGFSDREVSCNQQINILTPSGFVDYKYAYYYMSTIVFQNNVIKEGTSSQATLPIINKGKWEQLTISFPTLLEQKSIVSTLDFIQSKVNQLQANYDKISQECDALKQSILKQVFE